MAFIEMSDLLGTGVRALFTDRRSVEGNLPHDFAPSHSPFAAFESLRAHLKVPTESVHFLKQVHGRETIKVDGTTVSTYPEPMQEGDALITNLPGKVLVTFHGDCVPIYLYDPVHRAIGMIHSGWKGTAKRIVRHTLEEMQRAYGSVPEEMRALIGPAAGGCCYEVDAPVVEALGGHRVKDYLEKTGENHYNLDLKGFNADLLIEMGLAAEAIKRSEECTICNQRFFSHRRKPGGGLMIAALVLEERSTD